MSFSELVGIAHGGEGHRPERFFLRRCTIRRATGAAVRRGAAVRLAGPAGHAVLAGGPDSGRPTGRWWARRR